MEDSAFNIFIRAAKALSKDKFPSVPYISTHIRKTLTDEQFEEFKKVCEEKGITLNKEK